MNKKRLLISISLPIDDDIEAENILLDLRILVATFNTRAVFTAQIMQLLTPCCGDSKYENKNS